MGGYVRVQRRNLSQAMRSQDARATRLHASTRLIVKVKMRIQVMAGVSSRSLFLPSTREKEKKELLDGGTFCERVRRSSFPSGRPARGEK